MTQDQHLFDLSFLEQMDDKDFIIQVVSLYVKDTQADLEEMGRAFTGGNLETVYKTAHKLKSSTGMLQANTLFGLLEKTEKTAKAGFNSGELTELISATNAEFIKVKSGLELHLEVLNKSA